MMSKFSIAFFLIVTITSCGRKHAPNKTDSITTTVTSDPNSTNVTSKKADTIAVVKTKVFTPKKKDIIPPSIVVKDEAAKKAVDGRLYYDLLGNRYWKNYKNGKYYLFNQKMYDNPAFKPPK
jgi:hypothetical protein